jgi:polyphosphate kinase
MATHHDHFFNYELSWLQFNWRVLSLAQERDRPLLERVKFISIVCSNLDEFFQKRVGGLKRQLLAGVTDLSVDGLTPDQQLDLIREDVQKMIDAYRSCYFEELLPEMADKGIQLKSFADLSPALKSKAEEYFKTQIYPIITPLAIDEGHPFPTISNQSRSYLVRLRHPKTEEKLYARIKVPANRPRWVVMEETESSRTMVSTSELIRLNMAAFFPGMEVEATHLFRVTRNADIERNEEEAEDLLEMIADELRERRFAEIVRLELDAETPEDITELLKRELRIEDRDIYRMQGPIGLVDLMSIATMKGFDSLKEHPWHPLPHPVYEEEEEQESFFETMKQDYLVHHPYHSFELSTQRFVEEAAADPQVLAIKQTLYRTSSDSPVMHALIRAANAGKQVAVLVELKARFDEEQNIYWAQQLEKAGVHVSYGVAGLKIHSKLTIVVREEDGVPRRYLHIGTGNYHPKTAYLYEDFGLFTTDKVLADDVTKLFNSLTGYALTQTYDQLLVAPRSMRSRFVEMIRREIDHAKQGKPAGIVAKMNSLEDPELIELLYEASDAGVEMDFIVRGVCRLIPGKPGLSERIRVRSILGRFLEHSRCYIFANDGHPEYYIGSADWMHRNLDARVEAITPINSPALQHYLQYVMEVYLKDNHQSWICQPDGTYHKVIPNEGEPTLASHPTLMHHTKEQLAPLPMEAERV